MCTGVVQYLRSYFNCYVKRRIESIPWWDSKGSVPADSNMPAKQGKLVSSLTFYSVQILSHFSLRVARCHGECRGFGPNAEKLNMFDFAKNISFFSIKGGRLPQFLIIKQWLK